MSRQPLTSLDRRRGRAVYHRIAPPQATSGNVPGFFMLRAADEAALPLRFQGTRPCRPAWSHSTSWVHYASARRWSWNGTGHEPSIGLHPSNVEGLLGVVRSLLADGNSTVIVDHDIQILRQADWLIEIGPGAGRDGGTIITSGTIDDIGRNDASRIAGFLTGREDLLVRSLPPRTLCSKPGRIHLRTAPLHTVHALDLDIPRGRLTAVTGPPRVGQDDARTGKPGPVR